MIPLRVAIVGCGGIGEKRAQFLPDRFELVSCYDENRERALTFARKYGCSVADSWLQLLTGDYVDAIIVATPHNVLAEIGLAAIRNAKHVFLEKPAGLNSSEICRLIQANSNNNRVVQVGFNHRYHRAVLRASEIIKSGRLGDLMFIRGRYGHGGRVGYEREWRSNPSVSGGGELIDQGPHLIDLCRMWLGEFTEVEGFAHSYFWDAAVEDNAFLTLKTSDKKAAFLHVSCTEWKNIFSMEIYGKSGKLEISGLGGSYGVERVAFYEMLPEMGPPSTTIWEYPMPDNSWAVELEVFGYSISSNSQPEAGLEAALASHKVIEKIYRDSGYDYNS